MRFITGKYIKNEATIKQITIKRKFSLVLSIIIKEIINHNISLKIFMTRNFIAASDLPYRYFLNIINTAVFKNTTNIIIMKQSQ